MKARLVLFLLWLLCGIGGLLIWLYQLTQVLWDTRRAWTLSVAWDDLGNVALGGRLGQTISARCALACQTGRWWGCWACAVLDWVDPGHCRRAIETGSSQDRAS